MIGIPLFIFALELLLVGGLFKLFVLQFPDNFISRGLTVLYG